MFNAFGSGELQEWDYFDEKTENDVRVMNYLDSFYKFLSFMVINSIILLLITYI